MQGLEDDVREELGKIMDWQQSWLDCGIEDVGWFAFV